MNLFSYFFYRSYKIYKKYKELPLFSSIIYMQVNMNLLLCPLNTFISSLFHGENKTPSSLMFGMLMIIEMYYIGKYYKRNGRKILKEYEKNDTSRFDSFFPMSVTCILIPFTLLTWALLMFPVVHSMLLPALNLKGCLYPYVEFIDINLNLYL